MAGAGYEIPVSVSNARNESINPVFGGGDTTFNFSSPWASGGTNDQTSRITGSADATSSAALGGNAVSSSTPTTQAVDQTDSGTVTQKSFLQGYGAPIVLGAVALLIGVYLWRQK